MKKMEHYSKGGYGPKGHSGGVAAHSHGTEHMHKVANRKEGHPVDGHGKHHDLQASRSSMDDGHRHMDHKAASHMGGRDGDLRSPLNVDGHHHGRPHGHHRRGPGVDNEFGK
jgi:hypothetical protein